MGRFLVGVLFLDFFYGLGGIQILVEQHLEDIFHIFDKGSADSMPHHADGIGAVEDVGIAGHGDFGKGEDILQHNGISPDIGIPSDPDKLVNRGKSTDNRIILYFHMAGQGNPIDDGGMIAHDTIVGNMTVSHQIIMVTDAGITVTFGGTAVNGGKLPDDIIIPDFNIGQLPLIGKVLGVCPDGSERENFAALPDVGMLIDNGMMHDYGMVADKHILPDDGIGPNFHLVSQLGFFTHYGSRVNGYACHIHSRRAIEQLMTAVAATAPSTEAVPSMTTKLPLSRITLLSRSKRSPGTTGRLNLALSIPAK